MPSQSARDTNDSTPFLQTSFDAHATTAATITNAIVASVPARLAIFKAALARRCAHGRAQCAHSGLPLS